MAQEGQDCPSPLVLDVLRETVYSVGVRTTPARHEMLEPASEVDLVHVTTDDGDAAPLCSLVSPRIRTPDPPVVLLVSDDTPTRIFVPILLRPLIFAALSLERVKQFEHFSDSAHA